MGKVEFPSDHPTVIFFNKIGRVSFSITKDNWVLLEADLELRT